MRRILSLFGLTLMGLAFSTAPASADTACIAGNFSTIAGTTCDIGSLQFSFGSISGENSIYDTHTSSYTYYSTWGNSDFDFTPLSSGFSLTFLGGPQSITAYYLSAVDWALLPYSVVDLNDWIADVSISGGVLSASGNFGGLAQAQYGVFGTWTAWEAVAQYSGNPFTFSYQSPPVTAKFGYDVVLPFNLEADGHQFPAVVSAAWDGTPMTVTYSTSSVYIPEPSSVLLLSTGLVSLVALVRRKAREGRCLGS